VRSERGASIERHQHALQWGRMHLDRTAQSITPRLLPLAGWLAGWLDARSPCDPAASHYSPALLLSCKVGWRPQPPTCLKIVDNSSRVAVNQSG
jgi:hypothetical protein